MCSRQKTPSNEGSNLSNKFMQLLVVLLIVCIPAIYAQDDPTYSATSSTPVGEKVMIRTDTKDAVLSLRSSSDPVLSFSISYSSTMAPAVTGTVSPKLAVVTSVSSFDCLAST